MAEFRYGIDGRGKAIFVVRGVGIRGSDELGKPRLMLVLEEESEGPEPLFRDPQFGDRQEAFRRRLLLDSDLTARS
ncbi:hypothetical protein SK803_15860 [Lentzea sp. BCCO 10_0856]|uniref:Uncharacterized protein n=1 Tax=Lentzea miocenica TaxID=3095431 RepID=A0ABU4T0K6_9PSEU|nr:hypothetical protein [Lentzea sp. BCCO 10_0856]MDX8031701.1 hypothetical protein [Lentzea sp. BCCO 10_0856]